MKLSYAVTAFLTSTLVGLPACDGVGPEDQATITVMTRNVYVGADVESALASTSVEEFLASVAASWQAIQASSWSERVERIAQEIVQADPHVVGLQEISLIRRQSPGDAVVGGTIPATTVVQDYLQDLLDELTALGATYQVAAQVENFDVEVPLATNPTFTEFDDIRLTDYDVLLVRSGITHANAAADIYELIIEAEIASGDSVTVGRGWTAADVTVDGVTFRVANSHLESIIQSVRQAQAGELVQILLPETDPTIVMGDLNTEATTGGAYQQFTSAGYTDAWLQDTDAGAGLSCCHAQTLDNAASTFSKRIDLIFYRNVTNLISAAGDVTGEEAADQTTSGLWPSDHGGVVMTLVVEK
jgi:endonuclease/exonuclease/phosphatase family metal-dependent hydrolase